MEKIDFKKKFSTLYSAPTGSFAVVDVPVMQFVKIDGKGEATPTVIQPTGVPSSGCTPRATR